MREKDAFFGEVEAQGREEQGKILPWNPKARKAATAAKMHSKERHTLHAGHLSAQRKWRPRPSADDSVWERFKAGAELAWNDLKQAFDGATAKFK